ncbi:hypothetical protein XA68_11548 [Ophiocordyceps unilateralis]|uniref:Myb-like DNA-binding domain-containing protein n=1 Tax=Ophiocordyceps unilateralis TaxID=268505 RepID=A0A2A9PGM2_OPHUN|nr:hypothetical protein XA68_11548 [Ophiocordyceps unilateralis]
MSKTDTNEQVNFLVSCIRNATGGKPDFSAVAEELGIVSKAAAHKRYERLLKAYGVSGQKSATSKAKDHDEASVTPQQTPVKRSTRRKLPSSRKRKADDVDSDSEQVEKKETGAKKRVKVEDNSELSDPPASDADDEI